MLSLKMFLLEMAPHVPSSGTIRGRRGAKDPPHSVCGGRAYAGTRELLPWSEVPTP